MLEMLFFENLNQMHLATCMMMTGVIWVIQLVHYPSFGRIDEEQFKNFARFHMIRISFVVLPLMVLELISGIALAIASSWSLPWVLNLLGIGLIWASTFLFSIPCHMKLEKGKDPKVIDKLVLSNWPRTFLWSLRSVVLVVN